MAGASMGMAAHAMGVSLSEETRFSWTDSQACQFEIARHKKAGNDACGAAPPTSSPPGQSSAAPPDEDCDDDCQKERAEKRREQMQGVRDGTAGAIREKSELRRIEQRDDPNAEVILSS